MTPRGAAYLVRQLAASDDLAELLGPLAACVATEDRAVLRFANEAEDRSPEFAQRLRETLGESLEQPGAAPAWAAAALER